MSSEKTLRKYVGKMLKPHGKVTQLESGATAAGVPDTVFFDKKTQADIWIELKYCSYKKRFELRKTQVAWIRDRIRKGGHAFFLLKNFAREGTSHCLIRVADEVTLDDLNRNQNPIHWAMHSSVEWGSSIDERELLEELRK